MRNVTMFAFDKQFMYKYRCKYEVAILYNELIATSHLFFDEP